MSNEEALPPVNLDKLPAIPEVKSATPPPGSTGSTLLNQGYYGGYREEENPQHSYQYAYDEPRERPTIITVVAVLNFLGAALFAIITLLALGSLGEDDSLGGALILSVIQVVISLAVGIGLWRLKRWAYYLAVVLYGFNIFTTVISSFSEPLTLGSLLGLAIPIVILVCLLRPGVLDSFPE